MYDEHDHRAVGKRLDLFHFRDEAPGMVFFHPRGYAMYRVLEEAVRAHGAAQGYAEVRTPQILRRPVWEASGHWRHFADGMFRVEDQACEAAVKPVSCPGHIYVVERDLISYRELPIRIAELGTVHRDEPSGTLHGLLRVRQFTQDDGHIFCSDEQAEAEVARFCESVAPFYRAFGFENVRVVLSTRPESRAGDEALWDRAESALERVLERLGVDHARQPGGGAFYGPKLEFVLEDRHGRSWQCGTIQYDLVMPERFDLRYVDASGARIRPVMLHRALYGSLERFLGILLEHHGDSLPAWLAPQQVAVLPVAPEHEAEARRLEVHLRRVGIRAAVDAAGSLSGRIATAHALRVPFQWLVGKREIASGTASIRGRDGQRVLAIDAALETLRAACIAPDFGALLLGKT